MRRALPVALALVSLHVLSTVHFSWEEQSWYTDLLRVSPDLLLVLAVAVTATIAFGYRAVITHATVLAIVFAQIYRIGQTLIPAIRQTPFDPFNDVLEIGGLPHLLTQEYPEAVQWLLKGLSLIVAIGLYWLLYRIVRCVLRASTRRAFGYGVLIASQLIVVAVWIETARARDDAGEIYTDSVFAVSAAEASDLIVSGRWNVRKRFAKLATEARSRLEGVPTDLAGLRGADVFVIFVESYGRALFRADAGRRAVVEWTPQLRVSLERAGFSACSAFTTMSVVGGNSSFAHTEWLTGITVDSRRVFERVIRSQLPALPGLLRKRGYRSISVQPTMPHGWPEGKRFFGYDEEMFRAAFPYDGRNYHWGHMPDQYALQFLLEAEFRSPTAPRFVQYVSVTSHAPWSHVPRYYEPWSDATKPGAFAGEPEKVYPVTLYSYLGYDGIETAYYDSIRYSMRTAVGLCEQLTRPSLVIVLGDHQPPIKLGEGDSSRDVPVHVLSNRPALLEPFRRDGYVDGLIPPDDFEAFPASHFLARFLTAFGTETPK